MSGAVEMIRTVEIGTVNRLRGDDHGYVEALAASIDRASVRGVGHDGLRMPIEVRRDGTGYILISGLHRLLAILNLGRDEIAAIVLDVDQVEARLLEVEENLVRRDLDALDRAFFVLEFRQTYEAAYGRVSRGGDRKSADFKEENQRDKLSVWSDLAEERLGLHEKAIKRFLRIANGITKESVEALRGTEWARNQSALLALAGVTVEKQRAVLDALLDEDSDLSTMSEAIDHVLNRKREISPDERFFKKATSIFSAPKRTRARFWREAVTHHKDEIRKAFADIGLAEPEDGA